MSTVPECSLKIDACLCQYFVDLFTSANKVNLIPQTHSIKITTVKRGYHGDALSGNEWQTVPGQLTCTVKVAVT